MKVWWAGSDGRADGMAWDIHLCVYFCRMPSSFIMNGLGLRFYFLAEKLGYRTYNYSYKLHLQIKINHSVTACVCKDKRIMSPLQVCIS